MGLRNGYCTWPQNQYRAKGSRVFYRDSYSFWQYQSAGGDYC